ncbi:GNAT family N-acetyltransferase [Paenibacillus segetis]|uniref:N-acetyltransferase n=1 Tax=Paenibacillus segetis TaxID=1325360 RepID=A0ABQ1Y4X0_9BACL|nr:GNAT family N-acetyltransferase [Paenibacillus segetis]GGH11786.1 N-acetyltransferase [Paenibacillus segetis]
MTTNMNISNEAPTPNEYLELRAAAGLSPKDLQASQIALGNSIFLTTLRDSDDQLIGMGRIIGDGGCFYQIVDIAVHPSRQGQGLGKQIMSELMNYLDNNVPSRAYVSLIADVPADELYKKFGFDYTSPKSVGMFKKY